MFSSITPTDAPRRRRLIVAAGAILVFVGAATTYSLLAHGRDTGKPSASSSTSTMRQPSTGAPTQPTPGMPVLSGADPETFARQVAEALFTWDTTTVVTPPELLDQLVAIADPTGESSAGMVADAANYLPTSDAWADLRTYQTRQWIEITSTDVPTLWPSAVQQAGPDGFLPGTAAYTIHGVRHRAGFWEGEPVSSKHDVDFTVFMVCGPSYPDCHLLRLSKLDEPLS